jgi:hypothetical protein
VVLPLTSLNLISSCQRLKIRRRPVTPQHPLLVAPNKSRTQDFHLAGQEQGLYSPVDAGHQTTRF